MWLLHVWIMYVHCIYHHCHLRVSNISVFLFSGWKKRILSKKDYTLIFACLVFYFELYYFKNSEEKPTTKLYRNMCFAWKITVHNFNYQNCQEISLSFVADNVIFLIKNILAYVNYTFKMQRTVALLNNMLYLCCT